MKKTSGISIAALVLGLVSILLAFCLAPVGIVVSVVAVILGIIGVVREKSGMAIAGIVLGSIFLIVSTLMTFVFTAAIAGNIAEAVENAREQADQEVNEDTVMEFLSNFLDAYNRQDTDEIYKLGGGIFNKREDAETFTGWISDYTDFTLSYVDISSVDQGVVTGKYLYTFLSTSDDNVKTINYHLADYTIVRKDDYYVFKSYVSKEVVQSEVVELMSESFNLYGTVDLSELAGYPKGDAKEDIEYIEHAAMSNELSFAYPKNWNIKEGGSTVLFTSNLAGDIVITINKVSGENADLEVFAKDTLALKQEDVEAFKLIKNEQISFSDNQTWNIEFSGMVSGKVKGSGDIYLIQNGEYYYVIELYGIWNYDEYKDHVLKMIEGMKFN